MTLRTKQAVVWRPAPDHVAQVEEIRRTRVMLFYKTRSGRIRRPIVPASRLQPASGFLFDNLFSRAARNKTKEFAPPPSKNHAHRARKAVRDAA